MNETKRDKKILALLDAARELSADARAERGSSDDKPTRALDDLEAAALEWTADECKICGRRGDHEWTIPRLALAG